MDFDIKRATRIDLKRRKQREDAKVDKRSIHEWHDEEDDDNDFKYNQHRRDNQRRNNNT